MLKIKGKIFSPPPFLMSSAPKSGTHLLHQILNGMDSVTNDLSNPSNKFFVDYGVNVDNIIKDHCYRLAYLQPGEFGMGHIYYSNQYAYMLDRLNIKHIFLHRDPRDIMISLAYFIPAGWPEHPFHNLFKQEGFTIKMRCMVMLDGLEGVWPNFDEWNRPFFNWINSSNTLTLSYENLMNSKASRKDSLTRIVRYLWDDLSLPVSIGKMIEGMEDAIDPSKSYTFRKGTIGAWKEEFDGELIEHFKRMAGQLLIDFGYEKDVSW